MLNLYASGMYKWSDNFQRNLLKKYILKMTNKEMLNLTKIITFSSSSRKNCFYTQDCSFLLSHTFIADMDEFKSDPLQKQIGSMHV